MVNGNESETNIDITLDANDMGESVKDVDVNSMSNEKESEPCQVCVKHIHHEILS